MIGFDQRCLLDKNFLIRSYYMPTSLVKFFPHDFKGQNFPPVLCCAIKPHNSRWKVGGLSTILLAELYKC